MNAVKKIIIGSLALVPLVLLGSHPAGGAGCRDANPFGLYVFQGCSPQTPKPETSSKTGPPHIPVFSPSTHVMVQSAETDPKKLRNEIRETVALYAANALYPSLRSGRKKLLVSSAVGMAKKLNFPFHITRYFFVNGPREKRGKKIFDVIVDRKTLTDLSRFIRHIVEHDHLAYRIENLTVSGGGRQENTFVLKNLPLASNGIIVDSDLSDRLYRMSQIPGFSGMNAVFQESPQKQDSLPPSLPTETIMANGDYDILVQDNPIPVLAGSQIEVDNYGYAPTGALTLNVTGNINDAGLPGALFSATGTTSFGGLTAGSAAYSLPLGLLVRTGIDINAMDYRLGGGGFSPWGYGANTAQLKALGIEGSNQSADLWLSESPVVSPTRSLSFRQTGFGKEFRDELSLNSQNLRTVVGGTSDISAAGIFGSFSTAVDLSGTVYDLMPIAGSSTATGGNPYANDTPGVNVYLNGNAQAIWTFSRNWKIMLATLDQQYIGGGTLDPMLQATLGGISNVMALPTASLFGNDLYSGALTLTRTDETKSGTFAESAFFDAGQIMGINTNYGAMGPGIEESYAAAHVFLKADAAVPVGALPTQILGQSITAATGGEIGHGGIPVQIWISAGLRY